ncbi:MAG TPA: peptidase C39 family protein [Elusimicrobiota bacterium]|nr:peptidase C39 family protein [Elusimicrobiota bacterium]
MIAAARFRTEQGPRLVVWRGSETDALTSPSYDALPFDRAVMSWNASGPAVFELEVNGDGQWRIMGKWGPKPESVSENGVNVDTLELPAPARSFRFRFTPAPGTKVTLAAVTTWLKGEKNPLSKSASPAWGRTIDVPQRSQSSSKEDPAKVCSPTSLSMILQYYGVDLPTEKVASGVYDRASKLYGDWPFNTAYAHQTAGLEAYVRKMMGLEDLEAEIAAGRPVEISHRWEKGELDGAPISRTDGHMIVVVGFTEDGDVVVNDPAAKPGSVRRVYKRAQIEKTWLVRGSGIAYVLRRP